MRPKALGILLTAACAARLWAAAAPALDAPENLTLSVDATESGILVWDPIDRDDLMGFSVWMRKDKGDFTCLNIPTMVGGELKKLPMTTKSTITLKGLGKRDLELSVVAEYESGRSPRSASVFSRRARRIPGGAALAGASPVSESMTASSPAKTSPKSRPDAEAEGEESLGRQPPFRPAMAHQGSFHSSLGGGVLWEQTTTSGYNSLQELGYYIVGNPTFNRTAKQNWTFSCIRRRTEFPLSLEYGLLSAVEIGAEIAYVEEQDDPFDLLFGSIHYYNVGPNANQEASGFSNPTLKARVQLARSQPLRIGIRARLATGLRSKLQSWGEALLGMSSQAGLDDNAKRLQVDAEYGNRGVDAGLSYSLGFVPGASESVQIQFRGAPATYQADYGQEILGNVAYSIPWGQQNLPGCAALGLGLRLMSPSRVSLNSTDLGPFMSPSNKIALRSLTGINLDSEDQLVVSLELRQNLYAGYDLHSVLKNSVDTEGRLEYVVKPNGWIASLSGGFYY